MGQGQPWLKVKDSNPLLCRSLLIFVNIWLCHWQPCQGTVVPPVTMATPVNNLATVTMATAVCPATCNCTFSIYSGNTETVSCAYSGLTHLPDSLHQSLVALHLPCNQIDHLGMKLPSMPALEYLDLSNNSLSALANDSLGDLFHLKYLDLSLNAIDTIAPYVFGSLAAIEELNLAHNQLTELDNHQLFGLRNLRVLNLTGNFIHEVSNRTFLYLRSLEILDLSYNSLEDLPHNAFEGLESVKYIYLHHNYLHSVQGVFTSLSQMYYLDLSYNSLDGLHDGDFASLPSLHTLDLSFNNITDISLYFCGEASPVKILNLRSNAITQLDGPVFGHLKALQDLDLSQMPFLSSISYDAFDGMHSLTKLNLSHNPQLSFLHPQLLTLQPQLAVVDLRSNDLPTLSKVTFHSNPQLTNLYLAGNPWECGCAVAWIAKFMANRPVLADFYQLQCTELDLAAGNDTSTPVPLHQVSQELMQCNNVTLLNVTTFMSAKIGSQLVLRCDYEADETGILTWITPRGLVFHYHPFHPDATAHLTEAEDAENLTGGFHASHGWHKLSSYQSDLHSSKEHVVLQADGSLYIDYVLRSDAGPYQCMVHNSHHNTSATITLRLDYQVLFDVKKMSILVGIACAVTFFTLNAVHAVIVWAANKLVNKRRRERIRRLLESLDEYRMGQTTKIRNNYSTQLGRIRDHYHTQSTRLRLNYTTQMKRVRRGCSHKCERIRDNYHTHMGHLKEYSSHQIQQIREATNNQIVRIRDYGLLQMDRLRETYKLQHQHVMKILEAMNLENCRTVVETECMRAESMMFDGTLTPDLDNASEEMSCQNSPSESVYVTALNSDSSSHESLATMVDCTQVSVLQVEVLPHNYYDLSSSASPSPTDDTNSSNSSESEAEEVIVNLTPSDDALRETVV